MVKGESVTVAELPDCDIHKYGMFFPEKIPAQYDGKTIGGQWAFMCEDCFMSHGVGLGVGRGQRLTVKGE
jgi:hypothetical protein